MKKQIKSIIVITSLLISIIQVYAQPSGYTYCAEEEETVTFEVSGLEGADSIAIHAHDPEEAWCLGEQLCFMEVPPGASITSITIPKPATDEVIITSRSTRDYPFPGRYRTWSHADA